MKIMKRIVATVLLSAAAVLASPVASFAKDTTWGY